MGGGGGSSGEQRFAAYVESEHEWLIGQSHNSVVATSASSPYAGITVLDPSDAFFGAGNTITSYSSLFSLFENFMEDVDVCALYDTILESALSNPILNSAVTVESETLDTEIAQYSLPKLNAGMRDINAVMSTGFIHGKSLLESQKIKEISKFSATIRSQAGEGAIRRWEAVLNWRTSNVEMLNKIMQHYWATYFDQIDVSTDVDEKNRLWPFTVYDMHRANISSLAGGYPGKGGGGGASKGQRAASGALAGASMMARPGASGTSIVIGAVVGGVAGYLSG